MRHPGLPQYQIRPWMAVAKAGDQSLSDAASEEKSGNSVCVYPIQHFWGCEAFYSRLKAGIVGVNIVCDEAGFEFAGAAHGFPRDI